MTLDAEDGDRPATRVFRHVLLVSRFFHAVIAETAAPFDLQEGDFVLLMSLARVAHDEGVRPTDLYRSLLVTSGAITKRLDRLETKGLITRVRSNRDGRSIRVKLAPSGREIVDSVRNMRTRMMAVAEAAGREQMECLDAELVRYLEVARKFAPEIA